MTESKQSYTEPVSRLLTLGDARPEKEWRDYRALGLTEEDAPELSRMILDRELFWADSDSDEVWAPIHAWRALAQLEAESALPALIELLGRIDEYNDDWTGTELPVVLAHIGPAALDPLAAFLADTDRGMWSRVAAGAGLVKLAQRRPDLRTACVAALSQQLSHFAQQAPNFNALLISNLIDLEGVEAAPVIEQAFAANRVDLLVQGDWEEVQIYLGLLDRRSSPPPDYRALMADQMGFDWAGTAAPEKKAPEEPEDPARAQRKAERKAAARAKAKARAKRKKARKQRKRK